jgi:hypothetical protein
MGGLASMKTGFHSLALLLFVFLFSFQGNATTIHQVDVPETLKINGETLVLNGAGVRQKFLLDIYVGALYLAEKSSDAAKIMDSKSSKCMTLHLLQNLSKGTYAGNVENGIAKNVSEKELEALQHDIDTFNTFFADTKKGDLVMFTFLADGTSEFFINKKKMGSLKNKTFQQALLKVWLGEKPPTDEIKKAMLGK